MKKLKIVDMSTLIPGPFASFLLEKHLSCEVVKIEDINQPDPLINMRPTNDGVGLGYHALNKNKKVLKVDFRSGGKETIKNEVKKADVFIENFKPGRTFKLGVSYEDLVKINPKLLYCSITGFGSNTKLAGKSAHDLNILALSGYLEQQFKTDNFITLPPLLLADSFTAYHTALAITASILNNNVPYHLEISMYEAFLEAMIINNYPQQSTNKDFSKSDFLFSGKLPCYGIYKSKDDKFIAVAALEKSLWVDYCTHIGRQDLTDKQFEEEIVPQVEIEMKKYEMRHWQSEEIDFCVTPVLSFLEAKKLKYA